MVQSRMNYRDRNEGWHSADDDRMKMHENWEKKKNKKIIMSVAVAGSLQGQERKCQIEINVFPQLFPASEITSFPDQPMTS